jgi:hypothetical protein
MVNSVFSIETIDDYLDYFIDRVDDVVFSVNFLQVKKRILYICVDLRKQIESIDKDNFFQSLAQINSLEAQIFILLELCEVMFTEDRSLLTEEEAISIAETDCKTYFKERCGMTAISETPHSFHFLTS